jgi:broad specificity phosphatase PhoE
VLLLLRHGEAVGNAEGRLLGRIDSPLTKRGIEQAARLADLLDPASNVSRVITSPLARARSTAESLGLDVTIETDDRWAEVDYGSYDGELLSGVPSAVWRSWRADPGYRPPGGETLTELGLRVRSACEELFGAEGVGARIADSDVIVVSHVSPIKAAVCWALGSPDSTAWRMWLATGSLTVIGWGAGTPVLRGYNIVPAHDPADDPAGRA